jgi:hypothetical protein
MAEEDDALYHADFGNGQGLDEQMQRRRRAFILAWGMSALGSSGFAPPSSAETGDTSLDQLIDRFAKSPQVSEADVAIKSRVDILPGQEGQLEMVITLTPQGETKLIADPGITVTPADHRTVEWQTALPHRHVDHHQDYFAPSALIRLPFKTSDQAKPDETVDILVEYAYCVVDYQCYFAEQTITVKTSVP